jgi:hypothetical protein
MPVAVIANLVASSDEGTRESRMAVHPLTDAEESRTGMMLIEQVEHADCHLWIRAIIDGDRNRSGRQEGPGVSHRKLGPVRAQQAAPRPQSTGSEQQVIGYDRRNRPRPQGRSHEHHPCCTKVQRN